eukprot:TsM_001196700 transcript=TsM_001196700 gene=TsM_001196700
MSLWINRSTVGELFAGFFAYYANFSFARQAISVHNGCPLDVEMAIRRLPSREQADSPTSYKIFVEGVIFTEEDRADFCLIFLLMIWFFRVDFPNLY